ncbi:hypothetical protein [Streptomyces sp. NPDC005732]|uniref:hypothetical protein n=1 Tax=Streptomyces sp. NPDC005732 TaxID=3157057 RepID=UPI0033C7148A
MTAAASNAQWLGAGCVGVGALALLVLAWWIGVRSAHAEADRARAAYLAKRTREQAKPTEAPMLPDFPPIPEQPPATAEDLQTLQLSEVRELRARHRKGNPAWN